MRNWHPHEISLSVPLQTPPEKAPGMGADGVFQFKQPLFPLHSGPAQKYLRLNAHKLNGFHADNLINIDAQNAMVPILHSQPQGADLPGSAADRYHVYGTNFLLHRDHRLSCFYYSTFVCIKQVEFPGCTGIENLVYYGKLLFTV
jgi:hypothetical protein